MTDTTAANIRQELVHELRRVRLALLLRQAARTSALAVAWAAAFVLVAVLFVFVLPWLLLGGAWGGGSLACGVAVLAGLTIGVWQSFRGWSRPTDSDCAIALEPDGADGSLPTAAGLSGETSFGTLVFQRAKTVLGQNHDLRLGAAVSTPRLIAAPLLALGAAVAFVAAGGLPQRPTSLLAREAAKVATAPALQSAPSAADLEAFQKGLNERAQQSALKQAAGDLRDESKTDAERQNSLDNARNEAAKGKGIGAGEIPEKVPPTKAEREALADKLEHAASAAGARAESFEKGKGAGATDSGGNVKGETPGKRDMRAAPAYEPRSFDDAGEALSDQPQERRAMAQAAADALAKIKQDR